MNDNFDEKEIWDDALAQRLVGKVLLVGITYVGVDGCVIAQQQFLGVAVSVHPRKGILLSLRGQRRVYCVSAIQAQSPNFTSFWESRHI